MSHRTAQFALTGCIDSKRTRSQSTTRIVIIVNIFIDDLVKYINKVNIGCRIGANCTAIFLYADDVILLAPSVQALQSLVDICASELELHSDPFFRMLLTGRVNKHLLSNHQQQNTQLYFTTKW